MSACCTSYSIPGPPGDVGDDGTDGTDGVNAFTVTTDGFTVPAELANVTLDVEDNRWMFLGQPVLVQFAGTYQVVSVNPNGTEVTLKNLEDTANDQYPENAAPGTNLPAGSQISPTGFQGANGSTPAGALLAANNLNDVANTVTARSNLGLAIGTNVQAQDALLQAIANLVTAADQLLYFTGVDTPALATLTAYARTLLDDANAAAARATLLLGDMATQSSAAINVTGGNAILTNFTADDIDALLVLQISGIWAQPPSVLQTLAAGSTINPDAAKIRVVGSGGPVLITSTPTISAGSIDGQRVLILGTHAANTVTLQNAVTLPGSTLMLGAATRALALGDQLEVSWDATLALWCEVSYVNNS